MKVLIFIDWFAPAFKAGGPIQSIVNLVTQPLRGIEYRIICSNKDLDGSLLTEVTFDQWVRFNERTEVWYNSDSKNIFKVIKHASAWEPNIFFINGIYSLPYNFLPLFFYGRSRKIISARGMLHEGALSQKGFKKKMYLKLWKFLRLHRRNHFHATNHAEKEFIEAVFGKETSVFVAQNFPKTFDSAAVVPAKDNVLKLISIGLVSPMKSYLEVIKALQNCKQSVIYTIYGAIKDSAYWQRCIEEIKSLPSNVHVDYRGDIPAVKIESVLKAAHVFILPSKSENFGHAIYEALSAGKPVITSHNTPWNNLEVAKAGMNISIDNSYELSKAICSFAAMNDCELKLWSDGARDYAKKAVDFESISNQYLDMFFMKS